MNTALLKKTKAELINAYEELQARQKDIEGAARQSYAEEPVKVIEKAKKEHDLDSVQKTVDTLRGATGTAINQFAQAFETQMRRFDELQKVTDLLEERVKVLRDIEAGAEMGTQLLNVLEEERVKFEQEISAKRREWERTQEETEYKAMIVRKREEEEFLEDRRKKEALLKEREQLLAGKEKNIEEQVKRLETFDVELEKGTSQRVAEAKKQWEAEHAHELFEKDRAQELEKKLHELQMKELLDDVKRLETECVSLRRDAEQANKRAQDIALKIVESGARERSVTITPDTK